MDSNNHNNDPNRTNPYTLDPTGIVPPSAPVAQPTAVSYPNLQQTFDSTPKSYPQYPQHPYPYTYPQPQAPVVGSLGQAQPNSSKIHDWLAWSIINIFLSGLIPGIIPLLFSLSCRKKKQENDYNGAKKMSNLALISNILITLLGLVLTGLLIWALVFWYNKNSNKSRY